MSKYDWRKADLFESKSSHQPCGCGRSNCEVRLYKSEGIQWLDKYWNALCAFNESIKLLKKSEGLNEE